MAERITNFDDWKDLFYKWQKDIGFDPEACFEEVERWLRGDFGRAIARRGDVGNALSRGARRLLIQFSGLPRRRLETRTATFAR